MPDIVHDKLRDSEENYLNRTYWDIYPLFLLIQSGDSSRLKEHLNIQLEKFPAGRITRDERKRLEYLTVSLVNTFMIAAIQGGVYPPDANAVADQALRRLSNARYSSEIPVLVKDTAEQLCEMTSAARAADTGNPHVEAARHFLDSHLTQEIRLEEAAEAAGISLYHLCRLFKAATGQTMRSYLLKERIRTAKQLLAVSDYTIPQIAALLCFCDQSYFTRVFRQLEGITPGAYRDRDRK